MAGDEDEICRKRQAFIASLEEARDSLRVDGPAPVDEVRRVLEDIDRQLEDDERGDAPLGRSLPAR